MPARSSETTGWAGIDSAWLRLDTLKRMRRLRFLFRGFKPARELTRAGFGPLERRVMDFMWEADEASVREVCTHFGAAVAYTTLMTTLDRLYKKGLLTRRKVGRAFRYAPAASREEFERAIAGDLVEGLLERNHHTPLPLLSNLVEAVAERDRRLLDELERLVLEKRRELQGRRMP